MNYTIIADPMRGWQRNHKGQKIKVNCKMKSNMTRVKKYRKMLKSHKIDFREVIVPAGFKYCLPDELKEIHYELKGYHPDQDLYVFFLL